MPQVTVVYSPKILRTLTDICSEFGVGEEQVKTWFSMGAPIVVEGKGSKMRYSTEVGKLQSWRENQQKQ